jgi:hypothetical protein
MARNIENEIEAARRSREKAQERLKAAVAKQKAQELRDHERRILLLGTILLEYIGKNPDSELAHGVSELLDKEVTRASDRALFPILAASPAKTDNSSRPE